MSPFHDILAEQDRPTLPGMIRVDFATEEWELKGAAELRQEVFCNEQGLFHPDDRDSIDPVALHIVAVTFHAGMLGEVIGTVRIHEQAPGVWAGSRLAVRRAHRRGGVLGPSLIRFAVCSAHARGASTFLAHVQAAHVALFESMHWHTLAAEEVHGHPHSRMQADLAHYLPQDAGDCGVMTIMPPARDGRTGAKRSSLSAKQVSSGSIVAAVSV